MAQVPVSGLVVLALLCGCLPGRCRAQSSPTNLPSMDASAPASLGPFDQLELLAFLDAKPDASYAIKTIHERGADFSPDQNFLNFAIPLNDSEALRDALKKLKGSFAPKESPERAQAYEIFQRIAATGNSSDAAGRFEQCLHLADDSSTLHLADAANFDRLKEYGEAEKQARRSISLWPDDAEAHRILGLILEHEKNLGGAVQEYREALKIFPLHRAAQIALGETLAEAGHWSDAIPVLRAAIVLAPDIASLHRVLGECLVHTRMLEEGIKELSGYLALYPKNAQAHYDLGAALRAEGKVGAAQTEFQTAHHLESGNLTYMAAANPTVFERESVPDLTPQDGSISGNHYVNRALGFSFDFPDGWVTRNPRSRETTAEPRVAVAADDPTAPEDAAVAHMRPQVLLIAFEKPNPDTKRVAVPEYLSIFALMAPPKASIEFLMQASPAGNGYESIGTPMQIEIGGQKFVQYQFRSQQQHQTLVGMQYSTVRRGYFLTVQFYGRDAESLAGVNASIKSFQFSDDTK